MKLATPLACLGMLATILAADSALAAEPPTTFVGAVSKGTFSLNLRYRYEDVDQDGVAKHGRASTLRTALAYRTLPWRDLVAAVEVEDVRDLGLGNQHANGGAGSLGNGVVDRPVVADPTLTEINQAYLEWRPAESLSLRAGRQEIVADNARFVGNVGWRQNHQSFDAVKLQLRASEKVTLAGTYFDRQRTVTGATRPLIGVHLEGSYALSDTGMLRAYWLNLDFDQAAVATLSSRTLGASFAGSAPLADATSLSYRVEAARQTDAGENPAEIDATYARADLRLAYRAFSVGAGYEILAGSAADGAFATPLATLHAFNGWADAFLATPADGLRDAFLTLGATSGPWSLLAVYHDFSADSGGGSWGSEVDARVIYRTPWKQSFAFKVARYDANEWKTDTTKVWLWTQWSF